MNEFRFARPLESPKDKGLTVTVPKGLQVRQELLSHLATSLQFPDYFGYNWDALEECLADLSWLDAKEVTIQHCDLPLKSGTRDQGTYVGILNRLVTEHNDVRLEVVFPPEAKDEVEALLRSCGASRGPGAITSDSG